MAEKYRSTINGGIPLCKATNLAGAVQPMVGQLRRGNTTYLRHTLGTITVTFTGFTEHDVIAHNTIGERVEMPDWGLKALRMLNH